MCSSLGCHIIRDQIESKASHSLNCNLKYQEAQMPMAFPIFPQLIPLSPWVMLLAPPPLTGQVELNSHLIRALHSLCLSDILPLP